MNATSDGLRNLRASGARIVVDGASRVFIGDEPFTLPKLRAAPTRSDVERFLAAGTRVLVIPQSLTPSLRNLALEDARVAVAAPDVVIFNRTATNLTAPSTPTPTGKRGPAPYARLAIARALLATRTQSLTQAQLAIHAGVSQGAVAKALQSTWFRDDLLQSRAAISVKPAARGELFDRVLDEYPGPGGITTYWWKEAPATQQVREVTAEFASARYSGDVFADQVTAWRKPEHAVIYSTQPMDVRPLGYATAEANDYTLMLIHPKDPTIESTARAWFRPHAVDPIIAAYDVRITSTTGDEHEAINALREYVIKGMN
ncbi:hypothetical protein ACQUSY_09490 [Microbacterium sp. YY-03]|uniref:hypothetical protein n=1 Tax=Microbacterium sp. YY-03 TaxID=3421636 RepID=UPI003D18670E